MGAKIGFYLNDNQFIEGILLDVKQDHLVIHTNLSVFYLAANQIQALSKNAKDFRISSERVPYLNKNQLTDILDDLKYNWVTINCLSNHTFGGLLSKICEDHIILVNNAEKLYVKKSFISNIYKGVYETPVENVKESVAESQSSQEDSVEMVKDKTNHSPKTESSSLSTSESNSLSESGSSQLSTSDSSSLSESESSRLSTLDSLSLSESGSSQLSTTDSSSISESESSQLSTTGSSSTSESESSQLSTTGSSSISESESSRPTLDFLSLSKSKASQSSASGSNHSYMAEFNEHTQFNQQVKKPNSYRGISKKINRLSAQEYFDRLKKLHENDEPNTESNVLHDQHKTESLNHHELGNNDSTNSNNFVSFSRRGIRKKRFSLIKTNSNVQRIKASNQLSSLENEPLSTNQENPLYEDYEVFYDDRNYLNNHTSHMLSNSLTIQKHRRIKNKNIEIKKESETTMLKPNSSSSTNNINVVPSKEEKIALEKQYFALMKHAEKMYLRLKNERLKK